MVRHADTEMTVMKKEVMCTYRSLEIGSTLYHPGPSREGQVSQEVKSEGRTWAFTMASVGRSGGNRLKSLGLTSGLLGLGAVPCCLVPVLGD